MADRPSQILDYRKPRRRPSIWREIGANAIVLTLLLIWPLFVVGAYVGAVICSILTVLSALSLLLPNRSNWFQWLPPDPGMRRMLMIRFAFVSIAYIAVLLARRRWNQRG